MFDMPVKVPDQISTLELSKIWIYKALQEFEQELQATTNPEIEDSQDADEEE